MADRRKSASYNKTSSRRLPKPTAAATWDQVMVQFLAYLNGPAEASRVTADHYRRDLAKFAKWWERNRKDQILEPAVILGSDVMAWKDHLRTEVLDRGQQRKGITVNTMMSALKSFLAWAETAGLIAEMPPWPKRVKGEKPPYKAVSRKDQLGLLRAVEGKRIKRDLALVLVLLDGGPRVAELCALEWRDVKLSDRIAELYIRHGKGDKERLVPLSNRARRALLELRGDGKPPNEPVFKSRKLGPMTPRAVGLLLDRYARPLGISISPHCLRHTFALDSLARGNKLTAVQAILGHQSVTTTLGYDRSSPEDLRRAVEREHDDD